MKQGTASRLAWSLWIVGIAFASSAIVFAILGRSTSPPADSFGPRGFGVVFTLAFGTVGAVVASRRPGNPIGWIFLGAGVLSGFQEFAQQYGIYALLTRGGGLPGGEIGAWLVDWIWVPITASVSILVFSIYPDGHLLSRRWRWVLLVGALGTLLASFGQAVTSHLVSFGRPNPFGLLDRDIAEPISVFGLTLYLIAMIGAAASLFVRYRRSSAEGRHQIKWLAVAGVLAATSLLAVVTGVGLVGSVQNEVPDGMALFVILAFTSIPMAAGIAILKYRLYDIDVVINKAVVYGLLAAFITAIYVAIVVGIGALAGSSNNIVLSAVAAAVVALAFQPIRRRAQHLANRLVYGKRATPYEVLSSLSDQLAGTFSLEEVLPRTARLIVESTGVERAQILLGSGAARHAVASWPEGEVRVMDEAKVFPVRHQGDEMGAVAVTTPAAEPLTPAQGKLIENLASQAGLVLRNVGLIDDLRASRQRLVAAQDEERRKIERNIHDGAQQQLVALSVKMRLLQGLIEKDPAKASTMASDAGSELTGALEELRSLARGIYPPLLADRGLASALDAQAKKAALPVTIESDGVGRVAREAEAAVYFCCLEALQNIAKYASASKAGVYLSLDDAELVFRVEDDGGGFDPETQAKGAGLQNMADRIEALGGSIRIASSPGKGTRIEGRVPAEASK
ncbi:MAG: histidine kinase [Actinomycetota bacterium]